MENKKLDPFKLIDLVVEARLLTHKGYFDPEKLEIIHNNLVEISRAMPELLASYSAYQNFIADRKPKFKKLQVKKVE